MVKIKICGLRRKEDIEAANRYLPDYAGFVFAQSARKISMDKARFLIQNLDSSIKPVGVFVNEPIGQLLATAVFCNLKVLQLHGDEDDQYIASVRNSFSGEIWQVVRMNKVLPASSAFSEHADRYLVDTLAKAAYGGSGETFDWDLLNSLPVPSKELIVAGGLNCENVGSLIEKAHPYGVDVSSGVETQGWKDKGKIGRFICSVRKTMDTKGVN